MRWLLLTLLSVICISSEAQIKKIFKFSTFYVAANGGTSISDRDVFSVSSQLTKEVVETPYDYSVIAGVRKIQRFQYEGSTPFKDGTESSYGDAATVGRNPFEYLFEINYTRQEGVKYIDQNHFIRYVKPKWLVKLEYVKDGFADIEYYETTQRLRLRGNKKLSFNIGALQRISEPYGYNPLDEWLLSNNNIHYTYLAIQEGYSVDVFASEYKDPQGNVVATSTDVWEQVVIADVLSDYVEKKRNEL